MKAGLCMSERTYRLCAAAVDMIRGGRGGIPPSTTLRRIEMVTKEPIEYYVLEGEYLFRNFITGRDVYHTLEGL